MIIPKGERGGHPKSKCNKALFLSWLLLFMKNNPAEASDE